WQLDSLHVGPPGGPSGPPGPLPISHACRYGPYRVADADSPLDRRPLRARGEPPQVDLVGELEVPRLHRRAQGLLLWEHLPLDHVPLTTFASNPYFVATAT